MSRESLLDEAIAKAKEAEDWQLVEWLRMARGGESAARWYTDKLREAHRTERRLLDENAKLRRELEQWHKLTENIELPEYPTCKFQPKELERKNDELRKLVRDMMRFFEDDDACSHCGHDVECSEQSGLVLAYEEDCLMREVFKNRMRELGIEVEE